MNSLGEIIRALFLGGSKALSEETGKAADKWISLWLFGVLPAIVALAAMYFLKHWGSHAWPTAIYFVGIVAILLVGGGPALQGLSLILGGIFRDSEDESRVSSAEKTWKHYWKALGYLLLWWSVVGAGIIVVPLEYASPGLFCTFLVTLVAHQLMEMYDWDLADPLHPHRNKGKRFAWHLGGYVLGGSFFLVMFFAVNAWVYNGTGYRMIPSHNAAVADNKATTSNTDLADQLKAKCVTDVQSERLQKAKTDIERLLTPTDFKKIAGCKRAIDERMGATEESSVRPNVPPGSHSQGGLWGGFMRYWDNYMALKSTSPIFFWVSLIVGHIVLYKLLKALWLKLRNWKTTLASSTITASKSAATKSPSGNGWLWFIGISALLIGGFYWIGIQTHSHIEKLPDNFTGTTGIVRKEARVVAPTNHKFYGTTLSVKVGAHACQNHSNYLTEAIDQANSGDDNKIALVTNEGVYCAEQSSVCNKPAIHNDGRFHKVCSGRWYLLGSSTGGTYQADWSTGDLRLLTLTSSSGETFAMTFE